MMMMMMTKTTWEHVLFLFIGLYCAPPFLSISHTESLLSPSPLLCLLHTLALLYPLFSLHCYGQKISVGQSDLWEDSHLS